MAPTGTKLVGFGTGLALKYVEAVESVVTGRPQRKV
jgi:hypothetical protein